MMLLSLIYVFHLNLLAQRIKLERYSKNDNKTIHCGDHEKAITWYSIKSFKHEFYVI